MEEDFDPVELAEDEDDAQRELSNDEFCQMIKEQVLHAQLSDSHLSNPYPTPTHVANAVATRHRGQAQRPRATDPARTASPRRLERRTPSPVVQSTSAEHATNPLETPPRARSMLAVPPSAPHSARSAPHAAPESPTPNRHRATVRAAYNAPYSVTSRAHRPANLLARLAAAATTTTTTGSPSRAGRWAAAQMPSLPSSTASAASTAMARRAAQYTPLDASHLYDLSQFYHHTTTTQYNDFQREGVWAETLQYARLSQASFHDEGEPMPLLSGNTWPLTSLPAIDIEWCVKANKPLHIAFDEDMTELDKAIESLNNDDWMFTSIDAHHAY
ncbi:hypothetical protein SYNPS1DRAFT_21427 [Syncephalis pseudoplumigaleata]|uniref:Uncharacterized protein n=1 Tax=Syncephalis pseudoplumigaleata TaxID=1712513 RepID=A0A4P9Z4X8_9FUNG|nr:hypothetical protein SYNPS1DRAFT_21427 [Syncephalis pseudoplumigaleata]|eukprot:RKP26911.1 hypothetical protein SYNPS1DRAFT_21427 [Syncephalis pseudoplumigaleata]